jgi:glycerol kinase
MASVMECVREAVQKAQKLPGLRTLDPTQDIKALGLANQRETLVVWNRHTGEPLHNAIGSSLGLCGVHRVWCVLRCGVVTVR